MSEQPDEHDPDSILLSTKNSLNVMADNDTFDAQIIMHINSILADLHQLGVGPEAGFTVEDDSDLWSSFLSDDARLNSVKSYMYMKVKMLFDPPNVGYVLTAMEKQLERMEWRIMVAKDEIDRPYVPPVATFPDDPFGEHELVIDGGSA